MMVSLDEAVVARLERGGAKFEIFVDPDGALELRRGGKEDMEDLLAIDTIFSDARKGERASEASMLNGFGTTDVGAISQEIIRKGELQLTTEQRRKILEDARKRLISIISRNAINPQNNMPHPPSRIERAMEEANVHVDPLRRVEDQVQDVLMALRPIIPIKFETLTFMVKIPGQAVGRCYGRIRSIGQIKDEGWLPDGSWRGTIEIAAGMRGELFDLIQRASGGEAEVKQIGAKG
jgi:ribosome maturation protein SDO1